MDSMNHDSKIFKQNCQKFQKVKLEFATTPATILHSLYIVLGIISNLEMISEYMGM